MNISRPLAKAPASRMSLAAVTRGRMQRPYRIFLFGVAGVGKSTFAAAAPDPIFLGADNGTDELSVTRLPEPQDWDDVVEGIRLLGRETHDYKTLVLDPVNFLEQMLFAKICKQNGWGNIQDPGYGKGPEAALVSWRDLLVDIERVWTRGMNVIFLAHAQVKTFKNPQGEDFDRYQPAMNEKAAGLLEGWCAAEFFARHEAFAKKEGRSKVRGFSTGARILHTTWNAAFNAKNRWGLPEELPLSWQALQEAISAGQERAAATRARIETLIAEINDPAVTAKARRYIEEAGDDAAKLAEIENAAAVKLEEVRATSASSETTADAAASDE